MNLTCQCCDQPAKALIVWLSNPRDDGSAAVKLLICNECSASITQDRQTRSNPYPRQRVDYRPRPF